MGIKGALISAEVYRAIPTSLFEMLNNGRLGRLYGSQHQHLLTPLET